MADRARPTTPHDAEDENLLLRRFLAGDQEAFSAIYARYADSLLSYGLGLGFERELLKDTIQDVFWKLYTDKKLVADVRHLKSYLFRALKNRLINSAKTAGRQTAFDHTEKGFSISVTVMDQMIEQEERQNVERRIEEFLATLTPRQREAVFLRFMEEMEYDDIAVLLDITPHAARKLVSRAIVSIRDNNLMVVLLFNSSIHIFFNR